MYPGYNPTLHCMKKRRLGARIYGLTTELSCLTKSASTIDKLAATIEPAWCSPATIRHYTQQSLKELLIHALPQRDHDVTLLQPDITLTQATKRRERHLWRTTIFCHIPYLTKSIMSLSFNRNFHGNWSVNTQNYTSLFNAVHLTPTPPCR